MLDKTKAAEAKAKGNAHFTAKEFEKAIPFFTEAIGHDPTDHVFYSNRSACYASLGQYSEALEDGSRCVELKPDWGKGYSRKGLAEFHLGSVKAAEETYEKGLKLLPDDAALKEGMAKVQQAKRAPPGAGGEDSQMFMQVMQIHPKFKEWCEDSAFLQLFMQVASAPPAMRVFAAEEQAKKDERFKDEQFVQLLQLSGQFAGKGGGKGGFDFGGASEPAQPKPKTEPKPEPKDDRLPSQKEADVHKAEGNDLYKKREFEKAIACYDKAISAEPNDATYYTNKAAVYMEIKEYDKCIETCQGVLDKRYEMNGPCPGGASFEKIAKVFARMAACYARQKKYDEAKLMYDKSLTEDNNRQVRNALREMDKEREKSEADAKIDPVKGEQLRESGNEHFKAGRFADAKKDYDTAIECSPKDAKIYSNRAAALTKLGALPDALRDLDECLKLDPKFVKAYSRKGTAHFMMKEYHKALKAYDDGLKVDPDNEECKQGRIQVQNQIQSNMHDAPDQEQVAHAMSDPEIQQILHDPQMNQVLQDMQKNPASVNGYMKDPQISSAINKLIAAGVMKVG